MTSKLNIKHFGLTLGSALAICTSGAIAATSTDDIAAPPVQVALAPGPAGAQTPASGSAVPMTNPLEARVRAAAAEGNEALRRFIWRTRMIYNYSYRDFAKEE